MRIFEPEDVLSMLRFEVQQAGSQMAWAEKTGVDRPRLNSILNGRKPISPQIIGALGLRIAIVSDKGHEKSSRHSPGPPRRIRYNGRVPK